MSLWTREDFDAVLNAEPDKVTGKTGATRVYEELYRAQAGEASDQQRADALNEDNVRHVVEKDAISTEKARITEEALRIEAERLQLEKNVDKHVVDIGELEIAKEALLGKVDELTDKVAELQAKLEEKEHERKSANDTFAMEIALAEENRALQQAEALERLGKLTEELSAEKERAAQAEKAADEALVAEKAKAEAADKAYQEVLAKLPESILEKEAEAAREAEEAALAMLEKARAERAAVVAKATAAAEAKASLEPAVAP